MIALVVIVVADLPPCVAVTTATASLDCRVLSGTLGSAGATTAGGHDVDRPEGSWLSLASIPRVASSVASVPAAAGYVSLGAALLIGRSISQVLRAASRALDQVASNTAQVRLFYSPLRSRTGSPAGVVGMQSGPVTELVEVHLANESQWIIWLDDGGAAEWAGVAVQFDWAWLASRLRESRQRGEEPTTLASPLTPHPLRRGPARARPTQTESSRKTRRGRSPAE